MATAEVRDFFRTLRDGSHSEVDALLSEFGPWLKRVIRLRLIDGRLRRVMDTTDVLHSLIEDFLRQKEGGGHSHGSTAGLSAYLAAAVLHKIQTRTRKERRHAGSLTDESKLVDESLPNVTQQVEEREYIEAVRRRLGESSRRLWDLSAQGLTWIEIANEFGSTPDALRMRLRRDVAKALSQLVVQEPRDVR